MTDELNVKIDNTGEVKIVSDEKVNDILKQAKPSVLRRSARLTQLEEDERNERYEAQLPKKKNVEPPALKIKLSDNPTLSIEDIERLKKEHQKTAKHKKLQNIEKYYDKLDVFVDENNMSPSEKMRKTMRETMSSLTTVVRNFKLRQTLKNERKRKSSNFSTTLKAIFHRK